MSENQIDADVKELMAMMKKLKVSIYAVAREAKLSPVTMYRWKKGQEPKKSSFYAARDAAIKVADRNGTLPKGFQA